jgi:hypothetical protein
LAKFDGYVFSKLYAIGSKSEGPAYFLQQWDYDEIKIAKKANLWEDDPALHQFLGKKATIEGSIDQDGIHYDKIMGYQPSKEPGVQKKLEIRIKPERDVLWVDKMPGERAKQSMALTLLVKWPYRSIWKGLCPTSQIYDLFVERKGEIIWQWSKELVFLDVLTPVEIHGGDFIPYTETWYFHPKDIKSEGIYTARGKFIASGQEAIANFEIKFAY